MGQSENNHQDGAQLASTSQNQPETSSTQGGESAPQIETSPISGEADLKLDVSCLADTNLGGGPEEQLTSLDSGGGEAAAGGGADIAPQAASTV